MKSFRKGRSTTSKFYLIGGPYAGQTAHLPDVTMVFRASGFKGRYNNGRWEEYV